MNESRVSRVRSEHFKNINTPTTTGKIVAVSPETESLSVDIGSTTVQIAHPFVSGSSWIRTMPSAGTACTLSFNTTKQCYEFVAYAPSKEFASKQSELYAARKSLYRTLKEGEVDITSSGGVSTHWGSRSVFTGRAGAVSWSYDSDKLESTATAPTHVLRGHNNKLDRIGNEIRFGVVKRPTSYTKSTYALAAPLSMPQLDKYVYTYEYLMTLNNDNAAPLVDVRLGEVFDNTLTPGMPFSMPALSKKNKLPLRARYKYHNTIEPGGLKAPNQSTDIEVDNLGNVDVMLSKLAILGASIDVPTGNFKLSTGLTTSLKSKLAMSMKSELDSVKLEALRNIELKATSNITMKSTASTKLDATADMSLSAASIKAAANTTMELSALSLKASATTTFTVNGVLIDISATGRVMIRGAAGLSIAGALGPTGRPLPTLSNDIVTGLPLFIDPSLTS